MMSISNALVSFPINGMVISLCTLSFLIVWVATPIIRRLGVHYNIGDAPGHRKVHAKMIPTMGGIGLYLAFSMCAVLGLGFSEQLLYILFAAGILLGIGILDDLKDSSPFLKFFGQCIVAIITVHAGIKIDVVSNVFGTGVLSLSNLSIPLSILWILTLINMMNFIDGIDGLAAGLAGISSFFLAIIAISQEQWAAAILASIVMGMSFGFLRFNFYPAKIFMGDSGSMLLGYFLAVITIIGALKSTFIISFSIPMLILGIPLFDIAWAIFRRLKNGTAIYLPDRAHIHHQLLDHGLNHAQVSLLLYSINIGLGVLALVLFTL